MCSDPFLTYLKEFGYNVVRVPRADIHPLQVLAGRKRDMDRLGGLEMLLDQGPNVTVPPVRRDVPAASISGQRTSDLSIGVGVSILGSILGAMGGYTLGLDVEYKNAKTAAFAFEDVYMDEVDIIELDKYLADADVNPHSQHVAELLEADDLYVTTQTIKTKKLSVEARQSDGASLGLSVPTIQGVVGGNIKVSVDSNVTSKITFEGPVQLVFGFRAIRLFYDHGRYSAYEPTTTISMKLAGAFPVGVVPLTNDAAFVRLS
ncbi:MAG: hypothetical protein JXA57_15910 [Armatimonadetes bacterium]|nr:hypothetical protein [Armatimonadota bacterium]